MIAKNNLSLKLSANGPVDWDSLSELILGVDNEDSDIILPSSSKKYLVDSKKRKRKKKKALTTSNPLHLKRSKPLSINQESASFRTVGPGEDSTVTYTGEKYTNVLDMYRTREINPGYYGESRLTRL